MSYRDIVYEVSDGIATLTLNRPGLLNAARIATHEELLDALGKADADPEVRVVIVTGAGRAFCAGTDLSQGFDLPSGGDPATGTGVPPDIGGTVTLRLFKMRKPVAAAINGPAAGFGATLPLAMDWRVASRTARFGFVFSRRGIVAESCSSFFLPRLVGTAAALDWMLSGRFVPAEEALAKGLVNELAEPQDVLARARAWAREIVENTSPASVALNRMLIWRMAGAAHPRRAHELESRALAAMLAHPDSREGAAAFVEKRPPAFTGSADDTGFTRSWWDD